MCLEDWVQPGPEQIFKEIFLSKMLRYGIRSAILTMLSFRRGHLIAKEAVKELHLQVRKDRLEEENGENVLYVHRIISEDSELFYTSLENPESYPKVEKAYIFSTKKLTEEELTLLENRNEDFLITFMYYGSDGLPSLFDSHMKKIEKSSDPESIFCCSWGHRWTFSLHVTPESMQDEMRKRVANENLSDMESKKQRVK